MKKVLWTVAALALTSGIASAQEVNELVPAPAYQEAPERSALDRAIIANENKVADAIMKRDKATFTSLVVADGWSVNGDGFMKASALGGVLDQFVIKDYIITEEKVSWIDANTAVVAYKWSGSGTYGGQPLPSTVYASTVWTKKGDKWLAVFHQESEAAKPGPRPPVKK
jgi:ketosteroid isomerase-like protein